MTTHKLKFNVMMLHFDVCQRDIVDNLTILMCLTMQDLGCIGKLQNQFTEELMTATNYYYVYIHLWIQCCIIWSKNFGKHYAILFNSLLRPLHQKMSTAYQIRRPSSVIPEVQTCKSHPFQVHIFLLAIR